MSETRTVVILGASYAGQGAAHYFARHVYPHLPKDGKVTYRITVVDPSSKWYLKHASPRAAASEKLIPDNTIFLNTPDGFKQYGELVTFIQGSAIAWDPETREVKIQKASSDQVTLSYYALILATGTRTKSPLFSLQGTSYEDNQEALGTLHKQLSKAKRIVIAGGGATGVETAGELGEMFNGRAGWFSSRPSNPKMEIALYTTSQQLLPVLRPSIGQKAEQYLNNVGVDVHYSTKIAGIQAVSGGKTKVMLHDGEELVADVYIPAIGLEPMSDYVPKRLLDDRRYVKTNSLTFRVDDAGPRVYAIGDIASCSRNSIVDIMDSIPVLETNIKRDLLAAHNDVNAKPSGADREWKHAHAETQLVPVGQSKGVGAIFGWKLPSFLVWLIKGRNFMITEAGVQDKLMGRDWAKEKAWKGE